MARTARIVGENFPHHVTQRGNRRQPVFFEDADYELYIALMSESCRKHGVEILAYCLMTNHVHLIAVPKTEDGLCLAIGEAHRRYSSVINRRGGWTGHLFQGRFASYVMDETYTLAAARYIEMNPVAAKMVRKPEKYRWSSVHAHLAGKSDGFVNVVPLLKLVPDWKEFLYTKTGATETEDIEKHEISGRPAGNEKFLKKIAAMTGCDVKAAPRGRPKKRDNSKNKKSIS